MSAVDLVEQERRMREIIDGLPQREHLGEVDISLWVREVLRIDPERGAWHATRLSGIGGSEIGVLVRNYAGERADHLESARSIVERKLLKRLPDPPTPAMARGIENEDLHAQRLYKMLGVRRDEASYAALARGRGPRAWMRYSPDDVVIAVGEVGALPILLDYKAPTEVDQEARISIQYAAQLHMGAIIAAHNGIELGGLMLSQYDWKNWTLKNDDVAYRPDLARLLVEAGDHYWNDFVLRGQVPPYVQSKPLDDVEGFLRENDELIGQIALVKSLSKQMADLSMELEGALKRQLEGRIFNGASIADPRLTISAARSVDQALARKTLGDEVWLSAIDGLAPAQGKLEFDPKKMELALRELGVDMRTMKTREPSADFVFALMLEHGHDPELVVTEGVRMKVSPSIVAESQEWVSRNFEVARKRAVVHEAPEASEQPPVRSAPTQRAA